MNEAILLQAAPLAKIIKEQVAERVQQLIEKGLQPRMAVVLVADDPSSRFYMQSKQKVATGLGIQLDLIDLDAHCTQEKLESVLVELSLDPLIHGILLQFPLPSHLDPEEALSKIVGTKDVDGLTPTNLGLVATGREDEAILAATPQACIELAESYTTITGKQVGVVGRGRTVGRPLISMLINRHASVEVCHSLTLDLAAALKPCELVFVAVGKVGLITDKEIVEGQIVIDAGINVTEDGIKGDVDMDSVRRVAAALSPVPGGVGTLTSAIVFRNLLRAIELQFPELARS